jgi:NAD(P)-dependent dehydrogenase (short-subunit alcohol dehydrogenase family)
MSSQRGIRQLAQHVIDAYSRLDVLINNVGGLYAQRWETEDGIEATLAVTHLAPFLLTHALLPLLKASAPARIVNVTSSGHRYTKLDLNDLQSSKAYKGIEAYNRAKLVNLIVSYEFARRLAGTGVTLNLADPGGANTTMTNSAAVPWFFRTLMRVLPNLLTTEKAARSSIYLASSPEVASTSGTYFSPRMKAIRSSKASYDTDLVKQLWQISEELTGLHAKRDRDGVALEQFNVA